MRRDGMGALANPVPGARPCVAAFNRDEGFLALLGILFRGAGYDVATGYADDASLALIARHEPSVVLVDLAPGDAAALALLARLRADARTCAIPVLVTATLPAQFELIRADPARYAGDAFLAKPFDADDLLAAVRGLIGGD